MIELSFKIEDRQTLQKASFLADIFGHWCEIREDRRFPDKRNFRPQKFPKFLPQIAMVTRTADGTYEDRLTGDMVVEVLRLRQSHSSLTQATDSYVRDIVHGMLDATAHADAPMYFKGKFRPEHISPIDFTSLVLPFSYSGAAEVLDTIMLAFDFSKHGTIELGRESQSIA